MTELHVYLTDLVRESGVSDPAEVEYFATDLEPLLLDRIMASTLLALPPQYREQASTLALEQPDRFNQFCREHIVNYEDYIVKVLDRFAAEYLDTIM